MMLKIPFEIGDDGRALVVDPGSDLGRAQRITEILRTIPGERPLVPDFGLIDPSWRGLDVDALQVACDRWGPFDVTLEGLTSVGDSYADVRIAWGRAA